MRGISHLDPQRSSAGQKRRSSRSWLRSAAEKYNGFCWVEEGDGDVISHLDT